MSVLRASSGNFPTTAIIIGGAARRIILVKPSAARFADNKRVVEFDKLQKALVVRQGDCHSAAHLFASSIGGAVMALGTQGRSHASGP
jgi:hypothetical protein